MVNIVYVNHDGTQQSVDVAEGSSVMEGAVKNSIEGILAECGGCCSCATCHVIVDDQWTSKTGSADEIEKELLEMLNEPQPNSRLSCQIEVSSQLDGLVVHLPESQF